MDGDNFLDSVSESTRPEPNIKGNFDCMECGEPVDDAHYDRKAKTLRWWCPEGHESMLEKVDL